MLPEIISNSLASLQPDKVRYTKIGVHRVHARGGAAVHTEPHVGGHQEQAAVHLRGSRRVPGRSAKPGARSSIRQVHALLGRMHELAGILRERRFRRGGLELTMPEVKVDLDNDGRVCGAHLVENTESHKIIEDFMLAANEAVAELLEKAELHFLRRVHMAPDPRKLKALTEFVERTRTSAWKAWKAASSCKSCWPTWPVSPRSTPSTTPLLAKPATGRLQPGEGRPLRAGQRMLLPLHVADSPLSRSDDPPAARCAAARQEAAATTSASWPCWASTAPTASARPKPPNAS